jgi:hypothetical protein
MQFLVAGTVEGNLEVEPWRPKNGTNPYLTTAVKVRAMTEPAVTSFTGCVHWRTGTM